MSTLVHFSNLEYEEPFLDSDTDEVIGQIYKFDMKIGRTTTRGTAIVSFFEGGKFVHVDNVYFDEETFDVIHQKKFPNLYPDELWRKLGGVAKHSIRIMVEKEKETYSFRMS